MHFAQVQRNQWEKEGESGKKTKEEKGRGFASATFSQHNIARRKAICFLNILRLPWEPSHSPSMVVTKSLCTERHALFISASSTRGTEGAQGPVLTWAPAVGHFNSGDLHNSRDLQQSPPFVFRAKKHRCEPETTSQTSACCFNTASCITISVAIRSVNFSIVYWSIWFGSNSNLF